ncbi:hypothetical protein BO94DRAFT_577741 [Aspergillus sclerotioniger CBS 115572]|uniref:Uncharacterized protein n=1 Tax=Aspergillus sclerotioniger CBS 115572 TaxID=1450535 RepID=A0A317VQ13_9EURO|nr:hypothetical protein BO94DRAFT_577741 [Aspergillus sclerotioniger CBS 115572]PWY76446.1 hypothetical protein BO94DRAFT_577741 [Aspergillus sclerotioniger CBS 115572]
MKNIIANEIFRHSSQLSARCQAEPWPSNLGGWPEDSRMTVDKADSAICCPIDSPEPEPEPDRCKPQSIAKGPRYGIQQTDWNPSRAGHSEPKFPPDPPLLWMKIMCLPANAGRLQSQLGTLTESGKHGGKSRRDSDIRNSQEKVVWQWLCFLSVKKPQACSRSDLSNGLGEGNTRTEREGAY